ncbi:MAG: ABC transporter ATP-binding protein, partial [Candidatus Omnitrophica bacterium]|nr:ABC transporter ATP-binding protein [Candidatus Omnitrophota bacterium]
VMVTHNLELASRTDRRYLMRDGKLTPLEAASHQPALLPS